MSEQDNDSAASHDILECLSTRPPPQDVHNKATAVADLSTTLLDSLRLPNASADAAAISELARGGGVASVPPSAPTDDLDELPLLGEPEPCELEERSPTPPDQVTRKASRPSLLLVTMLVATALAFVLSTLVGLLE
jgi:hypothetical protein